MTTIKNVAKLARVSIGTVSNVLSGNRPVSDDVRKRVLQAIDELEYHPNLIASSLVTGRSKTIGAVLSDYQLGLGNLLAGLDAGAREEGFSLLISRLGQGEDPVMHLQSLINRRVDGIIWVVPETDESHLWCKTTEIDPDIPIVFAFSSSHLQQGSVCMDNFAGGYIATRHLIEHGCKNIAHIAGPIDYYESKQRKAGWEQALKEEGFEPNMVIYCDWDGIEIKQKYKQMLKQWPDMDAAFVVNDTNSLPLMKSLQDNNIRIPQDVKIIGFDDIGLLDYVNPSLTSIRQDYFTMGLLTVRELMRRIQYPDDKAKDEVIPVKLIQRQSCGCTHQS